MNIEIDEQEISGWVTILADKVAERVHDYSKKLQLLWDKERFLDEQIKQLKQDPNKFIDKDFFFKVNGHKLIVELRSGSPRLLLIENGMSYIAYQIDIQEFYK